MQFKNVLLTALTSAALGTARSIRSTTSTTVAARSCSEQYPTGLGYFEISQSFNPPQETTETISFNIPPNSVGPCQLVAKFPPGYPIQQSGFTQVNVFAVDGPAPGALVGTFRFSSSPSSETLTFINSFQCRDVMTFELAIASETEAGHVSFSEVQGAGLVMEVGDC